MYVYIYMYLYTGFEMGFSIAGVRFNYDFIIWGVLRGSWDLVTRVIIKVSILIITYNPT